MQSHFSKQPSNSEDHKMCCESSKSEENNKHVSSSLWLLEWEERVSKQIIYKKLHHPLIIFNSKANGTSFFSKQNRFIVIYCKQFLFILYKYIYFTEVLLVIFIITLINNLLISIFSFSWEIFVSQTEKYEMVFKKNSFPYF